MPFALVRAAAAAALLAGSAAPAFALTIVPTFDSSVTSLANASTVEQAFNQAASSFSSMFSNPVTVDLNVSWGSVAGQAMPSNALGASSSSLYGYFSYAQMKSWLTASASTAADRSAYASLPATAPAGETQFVLTSAQAKALRLVSPTGGLDGSIGFGGSTGNYDFNPADGTTGGTYDFVGVAQHEISEVLGRMSGLSSSTPGYATAFDLFRFSGTTGQRAFNYNTGSYFSVDNGATDLANFNYSSSGGDRGDWLSTASTTDAADAFTYPGVNNSFSSVDQTALDVLGWGGTGVGSGGLTSISNAKGAATDVPEPASLALLGTGALGLVGLRRRSRA